VAGQIQWVFAIQWLSTVDPDSQSGRLPGERRKQSLASTGDRNNRTPVRFAEMTHGVAERADRCDEWHPTCDGPSVGPFQRRMLTATGLRVICNHY
jgi:hypothetical protein